MSAVSEIRAQPAASASLRDTKGGPSADDARERDGCFGAIAPSLDALRPSPRSADRVVPPLRGASPSASLTASPGATRLCRVPELPPSGRTRYGVASCRTRPAGEWWRSRHLRRWHSADPAAKLLTEPSQMASPAAMARRCGPDTTVPDWRERLFCSQCGSHDTDMVTTGECR